MSFAQKEIGKERQLNLELQKQLELTKAGSDFNLGSGAAPNFLSSFSNLPAKK